MIIPTNAIEDEAMTVDTGSAFAWEFLSKQDKITPEIIKKAHGFLMNKKKIPAKYKGIWRDIPVWIGNERKDNMHTIQREIEVWCRDYMIITSPGRCSLELLRNWHVHFEKIHPFIDGNGRIGRLLFLLGLQKAELPFTYFDEKKCQEYYKIFKGGFNTNFLR